MQTVAPIPCGDSDALVGGDLRYAAQDRFLTIFGEPEGAGLRATLLAIAHDNRLATLTD